jgi:subtilisin family serine protease
VHAFARPARSLKRLLWLVALPALLALPAPIAAEPSGSADGAVRLASQPTEIKDFDRGPSDAVQPSGRPYADGAVLVDFRAGATKSQRATARGAVSARSHKAVSRSAPGLERLTLEPGISVQDAVRTLNRHGAVRFAEPDYVLTVGHVPFDTLYTDGFQWGLYGSNSNPPSSYGSAAGEAWETYQIGSRNVVVGILDTGVDINHKDLSTNIWTNPFETAGNGVDDDGNGYVDDVHGWDFFHDDASVYDSASADFHGTHVAGTIGAAGSNGEGLVGVNWAVTMIPAKFIHGDGLASDAVAALDYLTDLKTRHGLNLVATNNSWGGVENSAALEDAINRGGDAGILFVAAAGNDGLDLDADPMYPASHQCTTRFDTGDPRGFDCLISVAAITKDGDLAGFSNYGATSVDIGAPGQEIASTWPNGQYAYLDGTSMAAPHVTGAVALLASCRATTTPNGLRASVVDHGLDTGSLNGTTVTGDRLHIGGMMEDCDTGSPPRALLIARAGGTDVPASFWAWFSQPVTGLAQADFTIGGTSPGWSIGEFLDWGMPAGPYGLNLTATSPPAGSLTLTLQANSVTGGGGTGPTVAASVRTLVDRTAPTVTAPVAAIFSGESLSGADMPVRLSWSGADSGSGVRNYELQYSTNGGGSWNHLTSDLTTPSADLLLTPSGSLRFRVRSFDWPNHASGWATGPTFSPRLVQESAGAITYSGTWSTSTSGSFSGGAVRRTDVAKRSATYAFTGRGVAFVTTLSSTRGVVKIKLDGTLVARINLGTSSTAYRRIVWSRTFSSVQAHKVKVFVVGDHGRVDVDAFAVLK